MFGSFTFGEPYFGEGEGTVVIVTFDAPGLEYTARVDLLHYTAKPNQLHYTAREENS